MDEILLVPLSSYLGFSTSLCANGNIGRNRGPDVRIIICGIAIPPAVVVLCRDLTCTQLSGLLLPGSESLLKLGSMISAFRDFRAEADHALYILYSQQLTVLQREQRMHQAVHRVNVWNRNGTGRNVQSFRHRGCQISHQRAILRLVLRHPHIGGAWRV